MRSCARTELRPDRLQDGPESAGPEAEASSPRAGGRCVCWGGGSALPPLAAPGLCAPTLLRRARSLQKLRDSGLAQYCPQGGLSSGGRARAHLPLDAGPGSRRLASFVRHRASWCPAGARLEPTRGPSDTSVIPVSVACPRYRQQAASGDPRAANPAVSQCVDKSNHPFRKQVGSKCLLAFP